jgi:hypothetical protein
MAEQRKHGSKKTLDRAIMEGREDEGDRSS